MNLPVPSPQDVEEFKIMYKRVSGKELTPEEAWEAATVTLQLFYLGTYGQKTKAPSMEDDQNPVGTTPRA